MHLSVIWVEICLLVIKSKHPVEGQKALFYNIYIIYINIYIIYINIFII